MTTNPRSVPSAQDRERALSQSQKGTRAAGTSVVETDRATEPDESGMRLAHLNEQVQHHDEALRATPTRVWRARLGIVLTVIAVTAFILAFIGAGSNLHAAGTALHLFPSGFPDPDEVSTEPTSLQVAKYLAPLVSLSLTIGVVLGFYGRQLVTLRARARRDHVVVCGLGEKGLRAARARLRTGDKVTCIDLDPNGDAATDLKARRALVLGGDATSGAMLRRVRADRARQVVCACHDDASNAAIAAAVNQLRIEARARGGDPPNVYVHLANPELAHIMRGRALALDSVRLHFFNADAVWARALVRIGPLGRISELGDEPPTIAVVGATPLGQALFVRLARAWHYQRREHGGAALLQLALVDPDAERVLERLTARYPAIAHYVDTRAIVNEASAAEVATAVEPLRGVDYQRSALYPCLADDAENLAIALQARSLLGPDGARVYVPASAWTLGLAPLLLEGVQGVETVPLTLEANSADLLNDSSREAMAQEVHAAYLADRRLAPDFGTRPADRRWDALTEAERNGNRRHVDGIVRQLRAVFLEPAPESDWDAPLLPLSDTQVEAMAELEHERWMRERTAQGWRYAPARDDARKLTPLLVPWAQLDEQARQQDRILVQTRPAILARAGMRVVPRPERERLAELMHEQFRADRIERGAAPDGTPTMAPWHELGEEARELSYAAVDDLALQLASVGLVAEPVGASQQLTRTLDAATVEQLAQAEHDRWCAWRERQGWRHGPQRDDAAKLHPDLVPWAELPEDRRQIDRDRVTAMEPLLAALRYRIVPLDV